jgi:2-phosphosulfolactate phosphatase
LEYLKQSAYQVRFDWGSDGLQAVSGEDGIVIVVDVLSFSTCVSIAIDRNAEVFPYRFKDGSAERFAASVEARLAGPRTEMAELSLSPVSMSALSAGDKVILPSPNGATLSLEAKGRFVLCGCLRNHAAVARFANDAKLPVSVIAAGEKWPNGNIRHAIEDYLGAGAILAGLSGKMSPEAEMAAEAFAANQGRLKDKIENSVSGRELKSWGYVADVDLACEIGKSGFVPLLEGGRFRRGDQNQDLILK